MVVAFWWKYKTKRLRRCWEDFYKEMKNSIFRNFWTVKNSNWKKFVKLELNQTIEGGQFH